MRSRKHAYCDFKRHIVLPENAGDSSLSTIFVSHEDDVDETWNGVIVSIIHGQMLARERLLLWTLDHWPDNDR
jgi:hypothetical protein